MNVFAYCCASQRSAVANAAGVEPLTSPPMHFEAFDAAMLEDRDLLYFGLHGLPDQPYWYGDDYLTALVSTPSRVSNLRQCTVFVANCHFTASPFLPAIRACRPRAIIAGAGENFARSESLVGPHLLGYYVRLTLQAGLPPRLSLTAAKYRLRLITDRLKTRRDKRATEDLAANLDALEFEVIA